MMPEDKISRNISSLYSTDKKTREEATKNLVESGPKAVPQLLSLLDNPEWKIRYRAAEALGLIKDERAVIPLVKKLNDNKDHVRYMAAKSLGFFGEEKLSAPLIPLLSDENEYVRRITAVSLGVTGGNPAYESLKSALDRETDERAKKAMTDSVGRLSKSEA
ncbi:HEAT repeat protein [Methanomicrobium sp. W14]|uniref:HEAT repeat domain-containing protein n=1 Tax=Methanomicrobium sp. W14 TaxID=2817839 RepID=UPI001AE148D4|nr:HEAT repeat domain-containing protein [Methanomicrobium sp. W14]MBP2132319.1 HEAT repeat protein [Methanomicrobium sp. W14]